MYLYLLKFREGDRFKIGIANDLKSRIQGLGGNGFDLENSFCVRGEKRPIEQLEQLLLRDYEPFKVANDSLRSGNSEVFDSAVWDDVIGDINQRIDKFPHHGLVFETIDADLLKRPERERVTQAKTGNRPKKEQVTSVKNEGLRETLKFLRDSNIHLTLFVDREGTLRAIGGVADEAQFNDENVFKHSQSIIRTSRKNSDGIFVMFPKFSLVPNDDSEQVFFARLSEPRPRQDFNYSINNKYNRFILGSIKAFGQDRYEIEPIEHDLGYSERQFWGKHTGVYRSRDLLESDKRVVYEPSVSSSQSNASSSQTFLSTDDLCQQLGVKRDSNHFRAIIKALIWVASAKGGSFLTEHGQRIYPEQVQHVDRDEFRVRSDALDAIRDMLATRSPPYYHQWNTIDEFAELLDLPKGSGGYKKLVDGLDETMLCFKTQNGQLIPIEADYRDVDGHPTFCIHDSEYHRFREEFGIQPHTEKVKRGSTVPTHDRDQSGTSSLEI